MSTHNHSNHHKYRDRYIYDNNNDITEIHVRRHRSRRSKLVHPRPQRKLPPDYIENQIETSASNSKQDIEQQIQQQDIEHIPKEKPTEVCRICHEDIDITRSNIIKPCICNSYVHQNCLQEWLKHSNSNFKKNLSEDNTYTCEICKYQYNTEVKYGCLLLCSNLLTHNRLIYWLINWFIPLVLLPILWRVDSILAFRVINNHDLLLDGVIVGSIFAGISSMTYIIINGTILTLLIKNRFKIYYDVGLYIISSIVYLSVLILHIVGYLILRGQKIISINRDHYLASQPSFFTFSIGFWSFMCLCVVLIILTSIVIGICFGINFIWKRICSECCYRHCFRDIIISNREEIDENL